MVDSHAHLGLEDFENILATAGVHPHHADRFSPAHIQKIKQLARERKICGVREIARFLAELKEDSLEKLAEVTIKNLESVFGFEIKKSRC